MRKSLFIVLSCAFLVIQGVAYQFNTNTKYGKLQQQCIKNVGKSCRTIWEGCQAKKIGNACEAQYSLGIAFMVSALMKQKEAENGVFEFGVNQAKEAYKIGCKELKHKNTCEIDKHFFKEVMYQLPPEARNGLEQIIHGEYD